MHAQKRKRVFKRHESTGGINLQSTFKEFDMKRDNVRNFIDGKKQPAATYAVVQRLDESLPLVTDEWQKVEQLLMRMSEFAPNTMIAELVNAVAIYADDQARRGYMLGQEDLMKELKKRVA